MTIGLDILKFGRVFNALDKYIFRLLFITSTSIQRIIVL